MVGFLRQIGLVLVLAAPFGCATLSDREAGELEQAAASRSPLVGQSAPFFSLPNQADQQVRLQEFQGRWVVLYFYPADDTPGCTCQATEFTRLIGRYDRLDAAVLGVSPNTPQSHRLFRQKHGIGITLLSDLDHAVAKKYGAWNKMGWQDDRIGRIVRSTVLINPQGQIAYHWPEVMPKGHANRVRRRLENLKNHP